jgi:hypothetical protein
VTDKNHLGSPYPSISVRRPLQTPGSIDVNAGGSGVAPDGEDPVGGESDQDDDGMDAETERAAVLSGTHMQMQCKFLDALAELLSPGTGWDHVTATSLRDHEGSVLITASRNDGFGRKKYPDDSAKCRDILSNLSVYLSRDERGTAAAGGVIDCEVAFIEHSRDRLVEWLDLLGHYVQVAESTKTSQRQRPLIRNSIQKQWQLFYKRAVQSGTGTEINAEDIVSRAYALCASPGFHYS